MQFIGSLSLAYGVYPSTMVDTISLADLLFMYRLYLIQPYGFRRDEFNTGLLASTIVNSQRTRDSKAFAPSDFMPYSSYRSQDEIDADNLRILQQMAGSSPSG